MTHQRTKLYEKKKKKEKKTTKTYEYILTKAGVKHKHIRTKIMTKIKITSRKQDIY